jgi:hypothetical protein
VNVHNDMARSSSALRYPTGTPGQVVICNGWDLYQFREWRGPSSLEGAMTKWLGFAGGYGHLRYWPFMWSPSHVDRATRVEITRSG